MFVTILRLTACAPNSISAGDASQTLLGSSQLTLLLIDPLAVFKGPVSKGMEGKGEKIGIWQGRREERREGDREKCEAIGPAR